VPSTGGVKNWQEMSLKSVAVSLGYQQQFPDKSPLRRSVRHSVILFG